MSADNYQLSDAEQSTVEEALAILSKKQLVQGARSKVEEPKAFHKMAQLALASEPCEAFYVAYLDNRYGLIDSEKVAHGGISNVHIPIRYIARRCLDNGAKYICVAHNHPSGSTSASSDDVQVTAYMRVALELLDIDLIESVVVGQQASLPVNSYYNESMRWLERNGSAPIVAGRLHSLLFGNIT